MNALQQILSGPVSQAIGWALLHLLWQGAIVAGILGATLALLRRHSSAARYAASCTALAFMIILPAATAVKIYRSMPAESAATTPIIFAPAPLAETATELPPSTSSTVSQRSIWTAAEEQVTRSARTHLPLVLAIWLSGVLFLSLRLIAGWSRANRLADDAGKNATAEWQRILINLQRRMGLTQLVRLVESAAVEVPTVIGWLKPVILLPTATLSGMSPEQIEMILAHELAHIRRHDFLVNLLQAVVETLLFYHPAVWWISNTIRIERENCCDDLAVGLCGDALRYARALTQLEQIRATATVPALAANGGSLVDRVRRLVLGKTTPSHWTSRWAAGAALGAVTLAVLAVTSYPLLAAQQAPAAKRVTSTSVRSWVTSPSSSSGSSDAPAMKDGKICDTPTPAHAEIDVNANDDCDDSVEDCSADAIAPEAVTADAYADVAAPVAIAVAVNPMTTTVQRVVPVVAQRVAMAMAPQAPRFAQNILAALWQEVPPTPPAPPAPPAAPAAAAPAPPAPPAPPAWAARYHSGRELHISDNGKLSVDDLIALKSYGVTPEYIASMQKSGFDIPLSKLVELRLQGITPDYIAEMKSLGFNVSDVDTLVELRNAGVTARYVHEMKDLGFTLAKEALIEMRNSGVTPEYIREMGKLGFSKLNVEQLTELRQHGVSGRFVQEMAALGFSNYTADQLIELRDHGVTPDFNKEMNAAGFGKLSIEQLTELRDRGVTVDFAKEMAAAGYAKLSMNQLMELRDSGVNPAYVRDLAASGYTNLSLNDLITLRNHGVSTKLIQSLRDAGYTNLSVSELKRLAESGIDAEFIKEMGKLRKNNK
jgi:beta-lactamase regulating signal transducer with metallopeptidase domain